MRALVFSTAVMLCGTVFAQEPAKRTQTLPTERLTAPAWQRNVNRSPPALAILSPPGAGYDSTNVALTTANGSAVTVTRTGTQYCERASGALTSIAANKPCVDYAGALLVEPGATNLLLQSDDMTSASWSLDGTPIRTANTWDYGTGSAIGDTVDDDNTAALEGVYQNLGTTLGTYTLSCYLQSGTATTANFRFNTDGTGSVICNFSGLSSATERKSCTATIGGTPTFINAVVYPGQNTADAGSIKVGGCQVETGSVATSYIPTTTATASRGAQTTTVATPAALSRTEGCAKVCATPQWTGSVSTTRFLVGNGATDTARFLYPTGTSLAVYNGVSEVPVAATFTAGTRICARSSWSASRNQMRIENLNTGASASNVFTTMPAFDANLNVGMSANVFGFKIDSIVVGSHPDGCR